MTGFLVPALTGAAGWVLARLADVVFGEEGEEYVSRTSICPSCGPVCLCAKRSK